MYRGKKTAAIGKPATTAHDGMPKRLSSYRGRKTAADGPPDPGGAHVGFPEPASGYRGMKTAASGQAEPSMPPPRPSRHRMAGSTGNGEYITNHHRSFKK